MTGALRAELVKLARRPAGWVLMAVWVLLSVVFGYVIPAAIANAEFLSGAPGARDQLVATIVPAGLVGNALQGLPLFGVAIVLICAGLAVGGEYGWGTVAQTLVQRPTRTSVYLGRALALAVVAAVFTLLTFVASALSAAVVAALLGEPSQWPALGMLLRGVGAGWLILGVAAALGMCVATLLRSTALAVGLGLVYVLVVESIFTGFAGVSSVIAAIAVWLPGANAGSLAAGFAAAPAPGANTLVDPARAAAVLACYLVALTAIGLVVFRRRDITT